MHGSFLPNLWSGMLPKSTQFEGADTFMKSVGKGAAVCAGRSLVPLVRTRDFGMTPEGRDVEDFQIEPLPSVPHLQLETINWKLEAYV